MSTRPTKRPVTVTEAREIIKDHRSRYKQGLTIINVDEKMPGDAVFVNITLQLRISGAESLDGLFQLK